MKPGVFYGYAGPVCHCFVPPKIQRPTSSKRFNFQGEEKGMELSNKELYELAEARWPNAPYPSYDYFVRGVVFQREIHVKIIQAKDAEIERLRADNEKYRAAHPELSRVDHRTFGDLMIENGAKSLRIKELEGALESIQKLIGSSNSWEEFMSGVEEECDEALNQKESEE